MVRQVYDDIYLIDVVLPNNPLRAINVYLIKGEDKSLVIDTGFNQKESVDCLLNGLEELNINIKDTELFITHLHSDHSGMAGLFKEAGVKIYASEIDGELINKMTTTEYWNKFDILKIALDIERDNVDYKEHPGYKYCLKELVDFSYMKEGNGIQVGKYFFEIIDIPGHTPGQIGLYERKHKIFFGGDHVLDQITPNINTWEIGDNILAVYLNSLGKIYTYDIDYLFPAHRNIIRDHKARINELIGHHKERLGEILDILKEGEMSPRDVASKMHWRIRAKDWEDFPPAQKWFAAGEAMSHLEHLYLNGKLSKRIDNGKHIYNLK